MRLDKYLAEASVGTRKVVRDYVKEGRVTVNDLLITEPAFEINVDKDVVKHLGNEVHYTGKAYYMFHKPAGCITARKDVVNKTVLDYFEPAIAKSLFPVGRLDKDTVGLLLLTNDGEFSHSLMHPKKHVEKTYFFRALGHINLLAKEQLIKGINIGQDGTKKDADKIKDQTDETTNESINEAIELVKAIKIEIIEEGRYQDYKDYFDTAKMKSISINPNDQMVVAGYLTISEGQKHQVKRMLKAVGCYVVYLKRVSIGSLQLDKSLAEGQYRELTEDEVKLLQARL